MQYGLDMVEPPRLATAQSMVDAGWTWCAVYVGGPRATARNAWQERATGAAPVRELAHVFSGFLPIYVGRNDPWDDIEAFSDAQGYADGEDASMLALACGFDSSTPLCLDVEYGTWQRHPTETKSYIDAWVRAANEIGHRAGVYSDIETLNHLVLGEEVDFKWGAAWVKNYAVAAAPVGQFDPQLPPPWDLWQFGGGQFDGQAVDCNSATDSFAFAQYSEP